MYIHAFIERVRERYIYVIHTYVSVYTCTYKYMLPQHMM